MRIRMGWWLVGLFAGCGDDVTGAGGASTGMAETGGTGTSTGGAGETAAPTTAGPGTLSEGMSTGTDAAPTSSGSTGSAVETSTGEGASTGEGTSTGELSSVGESTGETTAASVGETTGDGTTTGEPVCEAPLEGEGEAIVFGGLGGEQVSGFGVGVDGSRYSGGVFFGPSVDLKPGGGAVFPAQGNGGNMWLNKLAADGSYVYGHTWPTTDGSHCYVREFAPDLDGGVYVVGMFVGDLDFDPGAGVDMHQAPGTLAGYLMKFDADGAYVWGRHWGSQRTTAFSLALAEDGSLYVTGVFKGQIDLDPGPGADMFTATGVNNAQNGYLSKFDHDGNYVWGRTWGEGGDINSFDLAVDGAGNPTVTGTTGGPADLDPGPGVQVHVAGGLADTFVESFMADGAWRWAFAVGGPNFEQINDVAVDPAGRVWVVGGSNSPGIDLDPGPGAAVHDGVGSYDGFIARYGFDGAFDESFAIAGPEHDNLWGISIDCEGGVYVSGHFSGAVDLDPGAGVAMHVSAAQTDPFVLALGPDDAHRWSRSWPNDATAAAEGIGLDGDRMVHAQISFRGGIDADAGVGVMPFASNGAEDVLLQRLRPSTGAW